MDTVWSIDRTKCKKCYACVRACSFLHKNKGFLGYLIIDKYTDVEFVGETYGCGCHHCNAILIKDEDGKITGVAISDSEEDGEYSNGYTCNKICPNGAMNITRW